MAEGAGLLNRYTGNCIVGSNPISSAIFLAATVSLQDGCRRKSQLLRRFQDELLTSFQSQVSSKISLYRPILSQAVDLE